jgi:hypothetical protein
MPTPFIPLPRDFLADSRIDIMIHEEVLEGRGKDCCHFTSVKLREDVPRDVGIPISNARLGSFQICDARTNPQLGHGEMRRQLSEVFYRVSAGQLIVLHRQADLFKCLSPCGHEGCLMKAIRLATRKRGLSGIFDLVSIALWLL